MFEIQLKEVGGKERERERERQTDRQRKKGEKNEPSDRAGSALRPPPSCVLSNLVAFESQPYSELT